MSINPVSAVSSTVLGDRAPSRYFRSQPAIFGPGTGHADRGPDRLRTGQLRLASRRSAPDTQSPRLEAASAGALFRAEFSPGEFEREPFRAAHAVVLEPPVPEDRAAEQGIIGRAGWGHEVREN